mmetsp:Transcript_16879/g.25534  ORF Transcript_16879/g.25534 Transcript_16879/m.25534 type:complete len:200 (+) Transcript_16879:221-820(+)
MGSYKQGDVITDSQNKPFSKCRTWFIIILLIVLLSLLIGLGVKFLTTNDVTAVQMPNTHVGADGPATYDKTNSSESETLSSNYEGNENDNGVDGSVSSLNTTSDETLEESPQNDFIEQPSSSSRDENNGFGRDKESPWESCLGMTGDDCCEFILSTSSADVDTCLLLPPDGVRLMNYDTSRVYVETDFSNIVIEIPMKG